MEAYEEIIRGISIAIESLDFNQVEGIIQELLRARRNKRKVLVAGAGRSGLVGRAFGMRLMHLDFDVYVMGETITPSLGEGDLIIVISGSGSTRIPVTVAAMGKRIGGIVVGITSYKDSPLGRISNQLLLVAGRELVAKESEYDARQLLGEHESLTPMGTLFEDSCPPYISVCWATVCRFSYRNICLTRKTYRMIMTGVYQPIQPMDMGKN